jgi:hypothetical protein
MKKININKRRKLCMKKNVLTKGILILLAIALLTIGFSGCSIIMPPPSSTGTVYITISGTWWYNVYMDYDQIDNGVDAGTYPLYDVPIGNHFFEAVDTTGWLRGYDSVTQYITAGVNHVDLYP